jgi:hypothetical protein
MVHGLRLQRVMVLNFASDVFQSRSHMLLDIPANQLFISTGACNENGEVTSREPTRSSSRMQRPGVYKIKHAACAHADIFHSTRAPGMTRVTQLALRDGRLLLAHASSSALIRQIIPTLYTLRCWLAAC